MMVVSSPTGKLLKTERLEARISRQQKDLLERAAALMGLSITDFLIMATQKAAEEVIQQHQVINLTTSDSIKLAEALLNPVPPSQALVDAFARYGKELENR